MTGQFAIIKRLILERLKSAVGSNKNSISAHVQAVDIETFGKGMSGKE